MRVIAAMSGGVDSAVAAARAVEAGHEVTGVHLALSRNPQSYRSGARGCCSIEDSNDARRAADVIGIPFYVWDLSDRFHDDVVQDFKAEYLAGRTPNPCLRCNEKIKFAAVLDRALALGFDAVATGHYARLATGDDGLIEMHRAEDMVKDQSYVLGVLTQEQLRHSLFPLGDSRKPDVRREAARRGLLVADKPDSHDICFIADGDTGGWLREKLGPGQGTIVDHESGEVLGTHEGAYALHDRAAEGAADRHPGVGRPAPLRPGHRAGLRDGHRGAARGAEHRPDRRIRPRWCAAAPAGALLVHGAAARPRRGAPGGRLGRGDQVRIELIDPAQGIAPGQTAVVYDGSRVVGSCTIARHRPLRGPRRRER